MKFMISSLGLYYMARNDGQGKVSVTAKMVWPLRAAQRRSGKAVDFRTRKAFGGSYGRNWLFQRISWVVCRGGAEDLRRSKVKPQIYDITLKKAFFSRSCQPRLKAKNWSSLGNLWALQLWSLLGIFRRPWSPGRLGRPWPRGVLWWSSLRRTRPWRPWPWQP